jgi:hypothetical protein
MSTSGRVDKDTFSVGDFAVLETFPDGRFTEPRYGVVQYDGRGPILRLGPFHDFEWACRQCNRIAHEGFVADELMAANCQAGLRWA